MQWLFLCLFFCFTRKVSLNNIEIVYPKIYEKENVIELDSLVLALKSESDFFRNTQVKWIGEDGEQLDEKSSTKCDYKTGIVKELPLFSRVTISLCDGGEINGIIQFDNKIYLVQPLVSATNQSVSSNGAHIIYEGNLHKDCLMYKYIFNFYSLFTFSKQFLPNKTFN